MTYQQGAACLLFLSVLAASAESAETFRPQIPKTWEDAAMKDVELPLAHAEYSPRHISAEFYYKMPVPPLYRSYAVYHPDREPQGYLEWLRQREPATVWDSSKLKTRNDWIRAGELVFSAPVGYGSIAVRGSDGEDLYVRERSWYEKVRPPVSSDGILPFYRYIIREKGKIELGVLSCAMCHTRVLSDGSTVKGAQGNFPFDAAFAQDILAGTATEAINQQLFNTLYARPWVKSEDYSRLAGMDRAGMATLLTGRPPGVLTRHRLSPDNPVQIPDLIGVEHRKYLDHTGLQRHRDIGDLMRYAALNQGADGIADFGGFIPFTAVLGSNQVQPEQGSRYSDEQLFALALYVYSLRPPVNPHQPNSETARGAQIFAREGCNGCHTPPLYTNNKLVPAPGFHVPDAHKERYDILPVPLGTDASVTLNTLRGTGYYRVPSLKGVWYRGPFEHTGAVATLEDWFDPRRLQDDYVRAGFSPPSRTTGAVKGHEFGLKLQPDEKRALIAFLKIL